jgi:uncharacterized protein
VQFAECSFVVKQVEGAHMDLWFREFCVCKTSRYARSGRLVGRPRVRREAKRRGGFCRALAILLALLVPGTGAAAEKPKVRAITAFVRIDYAKYADQVQEAVLVLRRAQAEFERAGFEVQSIRITTQAFPEYVQNLSREDALTFFHQYDQLARREHFSASIGPAMRSAKDGVQYAELLGEILRTTDLEGSIVAAGEDGIHWDAVRAAAKLIKDVSTTTPRGEGNFRFAATALLPPNGPFYPGSYHTGPGHEFTVGLESAGVVGEALAASRWDPSGARERLKTLLGGYARVIEEIARGVQEKTGWRYVGLDLSTAPNKEVSIGAAIEQFTGAKFGSSGTMTAASLITQALQEIPVKHAGYSGLMLPILEDNVLAARWSEGAVTVDALLAYSSVCGTGLDTIPLPGDVTREQLERMIADMATLAVKWHKPLSARLLPAAGKNEGDRTEFDNPSLVNATLRPLP